MARQPNDAALRLEYAELLSANPDRRDEAIEEYRILLARNPRPATREALADLLSGRAATRKEALKEYRALVRERPNDARLRLKYARLLGGQRGDAQEAIRQYSIVVEQDPKNARAHEGLAQSYAWVDDRDSALQHSDLAIRYGARGREVFDLHRDLLRGREPRLAPFLSGLFQSGDEKSDLGGAAIGVEGRADITPFLTFEGRAGFEEYWSHGETEAAAFARVGGEYRLDPDREIDLGIAYDSLSDGSSNVLGDAAYGWSGEGWRARLGFERQLRYDSLIALVGDDVGGTSIGSARENRFYGVLGTEGGRLDARIEPYTGWVSADGVDANFFIGARARVDYGLFDDGWYGISPMYRVEISHYDEDAFGVVPSNDEPLPGGYFSPQLFFEQVVGLSLRLRWGADRFLDLEGGPALQAVNESHGGTEWKLGGEGRLSLVFFVRESLFWTLETDYSGIGGAYTRFAGKTSLVFKF